MAVFPSNKSKNNKRRLFATVVRSFHKNSLRRKGRETVFIHHHHQNHRNPFHNQSFRRKGRDEQLSSWTENT